MLNLLKKRKENKNKNVIKILNITSKKFTTYEVYVLMEQKKVLHCIKIPTIILITVGQYRRFKVTIIKKKMMYFMYHKCLLNRNAFLIN